MTIMDYADLTIITGDQGDGKSNTGTGLAVDDYMAHAVAASPDGKRKYPIHDFYPRYTCEVGEKIFYVPKDYSIESPIKIFANYHLYGVTYVLMPLVRMIAEANSDLLTNCWQLIDESADIDCRNSMTMVGKIQAWLGASTRKTAIHKVIMTQFESQIEKRYRAFATRRILCKYNKQTHEITITVKEKGEREKEYTYYAPTYWRFFDTKERQKIPDQMIAKALVAVGDV